MFPVVPDLVSAEVVGCLAMPFHLGAGAWARPSPWGGWALVSCGPVENRLTQFDSPLCLATPF